MPDSSLPELRFESVLGVRMAYRELGSGPPIVLLHGNPTSSYLWRGVMPTVARHGRVLAPDLLGMGSSGAAEPPVPAAYRYVEQRRHLDALLAALGVDEDVTLVAHDWGGVLAVDWARRHPGAVRGLALTETMVGPRRLADEDEGGQQLFAALRDERGEQMVLEDNVFVEQVLAGATRDLDPADLAVYREPYLQPGAARMPMLVWAREIPFDGAPARTHEVLVANHRWLAATDTPVLFVAADPGAILVGPDAAWLRSLDHVVTVEVAAGHFVPEDAPRALADALDVWLTSLDGGRWTP